VLGVILHASSGYNGGRHEEHCSLDFGSIGYGIGGVRRQRQAGDGSDLDDLGPDRPGSSRAGDDRSGSSRSGNAGSPGDAFDPRNAVEVIAS
jgi:hypothetical protein